MDHLFKTKEKKSSKSERQSQSDKPRGLPSLPKEVKSAEPTDQQSRSEVPSTELRQVKSNPADRKVTFKDLSRRRAHPPKRRRSLSPPSRSSSNDTTRLGNGLDTEKYLSMSDLDKPWSPPLRSEKHSKSGNKFKRKNEAHPQLHQEDDSDHHSQNVSDLSDDATSKRRQQTEVQNSKSRNLSVRPAGKSRKNCDEEGDRSVVSTRDNSEVKVDRAYVKDLQSTAISNLFRLKYYNDATALCPKEHFEKAISELKTIFDDFDTGGD